MPLLAILINNLSPVGLSIYLLETVDNSNVNLQWRTTESDHVCYIGWGQYFPNFTMRLDHLGILFKCRFGFNRSSVCAEESAFLAIFQERPWGLAWPSVPCSHKSSSVYTLFLEKSCILYVAKKSTDEKAVLISVMSDFPKWSSEHPTGV